MLKHTKRLERVITKWLQNEFDINLTAFLGTDFGYYYETEEIEFALVVSEKMDAWFLEFIRNTYNVSFADCFLISLLHEIGHHFTFYSVDEEVEAECEKVKATLINGTKEEAFMYFTLPDEIIATNWAINFYKNNKKLCLDFMKKVSKEIRTFVLLNRIEV